MTSPNEQEPQPQGASAFGELKRRDWVFLAVCSAGALACFIWSVKLAVEHYSPQSRASEFSSSHRPR
jgi:hypothetical protein